MFLNFYSRYKKKFLVSKKYIMVSMQGVYPFFDYEFAEPAKVLGVGACPLTYPQDSLMGFLQKNAPTYAFLVKTARLDWQLADPSFRGTVFLPDTINENVVLNADVDTARRIVKYHLMIGYFPKDVLFTSPYQQLQTSIKSQTIRAVIQGPSTLMLNENVYVTEFDRWCLNGVIHRIHQPLYPLDS
jgi:hypothetical protein